jgi:hypothetical protein
VNVRAEWRYVSNPDWQEVDHLDIERSFTCFPMENTDVPFRIDLKGMTVAFWSKFLLFSCSRRDCSFNRS